MGDGPSHEHADGLFGYDGSIEIRLLPVSLLEVAKDDGAGFGSVGLPGGVRLDCEDAHGGNGGDVVSVPQALVFGFVDLLVGGLVDESVAFLIVGG
jgi:hypothetical protein